MQTIFPTREALRIEVAIRPGDLQDGPFRAETWERDVFLHITLNARRTWRSPRVKFAFGTSSTRRWRVATSTCSQGGNGALMRLRIRGDIEASLVTIMVRSSAL